MEGYLLKVVNWQLLYWLTTLGVGKDGSTSTTTDANSSSIVGLDGCPISGGAEATSMTTTTLTGGQPSETSAPLVQPMVALQMVADSTTNPPVPAGSGSSAVSCSMDDSAVRDAQIEGKWFRSVIILPSLTCTSPIYRLATVRHSHAALPKPNWLPTTGRSTQTQCWPSNWPATAEATAQFQFTWPLTCLSSTSSTADGVATSANLDGMLFGVYLSLWGTGKQQQQWRRQSAQHFCTISADQCTSTASPTTCLNTGFSEPPELPSNGLWWLQLQLQQQHLSVFLLLQRPSEYALLGRDLWPGRSSAAPLQSQVTAPPPHQYTSVISLHDQLEHPANVSRRAVSSFRHWQCSQNRSATDEPQQQQQQHLTGPRWGLQQSYGSHQPQQQFHCLLLLSVRFLFLRRLWWGLRSSRPWQSTFRSCAVAVLRAVDVL